MFKDFPFMAAEGGCFLTPGLPLSEAVSDLGALLNRLSKSGCSVASQIRGQHPADCPPPIRLKFQIRPQAQSKSRRGVYSNVAAFLFLFLAAALDRPGPDLIGVLLQNQSPRSWPGHENRGRVGRWELRPMLNLDGHQLTN